MSFITFLRLSGVPGDGRDDRHADWIDIESWSWELMNARSALGAGGHGGKPESHEFSVTKRLDRSSPVLLTLCATGQHVAEAAIECTRSSGERQRFLEITLQDVVVSKFAPRAVVGTDAPTEDVAFRFGRVRWKYFVFDATGQPKGEVVGGWDFVKGVTFG